MEERQGLESQRAWDGAEENENPRVVQQGSVFAGRKSLGPLMPATQHTSITDRGDEDVPGWSPMPSPPSPGPPGPPPSDEDDESHTAFVAVSRRPALEGELQGSDPISSLVIRCSHTSSQEGTAGEDAHDTERNKFQDLDVRASTLLERCRELLAAPLAASGQVSFAVGDVVVKQGTLCLMTHARPTERTRCQVTVHPRRFMSADIINRASAASTDALGEMIA